MYLGLSGFSHREMRKCASPSLDDSILAQCPEKSGKEVGKLLPTLHTRQNSVLYWPCKGKISSAREGAGW